jgi:hypothetical protein
MKLELEHQDTHGKTFFYIIYVIYLSQKCCTEGPAIQVCISPSQVSTVNENMKQISEYHMRTETQVQLIHIALIHFHMQVATTR